MPRRAPSRTIRRKLDDLGIGVPLVGDFHYNGHKLLTEYPGAAAALAKYRINPGNVGSKRRDEHFVTIIRVALDYDRPVRIGVNWGSLDQDLLTTLMDENARRPDPLEARDVTIEAMLQSALRSAELAEATGLGHDRIIISAKVSGVADLVTVYRELARRCDYPLHLGLTEAGMGMKGTVASTAALAILLADGIGDTIRVSLTPQPGGDRAEEVRISMQVLQSLGTAIVPAAGERVSRLRPDDEHVLRRDGAAYRRAHRRTPAGLDVDLPRHRRRGHARRGHGLRRERARGVAPRRHRDQPAGHVRGARRARLHRRRARPDAAGRGTRGRVHRHPRRLRGTALRRGRSRLGGGRGRRTPLHGRSAVRSPPASPFQAAPGGFVSQSGFVSSITRQSEDFPGWYNDVVLKAELADYSPVRGCMIIRPYGYAIWESMRDELDRYIKRTGHSNVYFPLFVPRSLLEKEADHVEGFDPQVAWVTHAGGEELTEWLAIRPTSETIIAEAVKDWIQSYRDLPLLMNLWNNVVRWEMRTRLFLRTAEFLWQEAHTFHATEEEAAEEVATGLEGYRAVAEEWLAIPVIRGRKSHGETFPGAVYTHAVEAMMRDRKALQAGHEPHARHELRARRGHRVPRPRQRARNPWGTSWGFSTRMVGATIMAHGDDSGSSCRPTSRPIQVVVVPIFRTEEDRVAVAGAIEQVERALADVTDALRPPAPEGRLARGHAGLQVQPLGAAGRAPSARDRSARRRGRTGRRRAAPRPREGGRRRSTTLATELPRRLEAYQPTCSLVRSPSGPRTPTPSIPGDDSRRSSTARAASSWRPGAARPTASDGEHRDRGEHPGHPVRLARRGRPLRRRWAPSERRVLFARAY